jgi:hypothetical protein
MIFESTKDLAISSFVAIIVGQSGIGKTSQVRYLPEDRTLIISAEKGLRCLHGTNYKVKQIKDMNGLKEVYTYLSSEIRPFDYIFIDSLTEILEICLDELKADPRFQDPKMMLKMYGQYNETATKLIKAFRDIEGYSIIFTCLSEVEKNGMELVDAFNIPGSAVKANLPAWFDLCLHLKVFKDDKGKSHRRFITNNAHSNLAKDRTGKLEEFEEANLGVVIKKVLGK